MNLLMAHPGFPDGHWIGYRASGVGLINSAFLTTQSEWVIFARKSWHIEEDSGQKNEEALVSGFE